MTYCPKCGTANRDGSRFCNECGEPLGTQAQVKCPECGTLNPSQNLFCSECRARLLPPASPPGEVPAALKGLSLPTKGLMDEGLMPEEVGGEPVGEMMPEPESEIPGWLRDLGASLSGEQKPIEQDPPDGASEVPDWLRDLRASLPAEPEQEPERTEEQEQPSNSPAQGGLGGAEEEPEPEPPISRSEEEQMPDWLTGLAFASAKEEPERPASEGVPPVPAAEGEEEPDWLAELRSSSAQDEPVPPISEGVPPISMAEEVQVPDWLAELGAFRAKEEPEPEAPISEGMPPISGAEEPPDWLAELRSSLDEEEGPVPPAPEAEEETLEPLAELQPSDLEAEPEPTPPDWLTELRASGEPVEAETPPPEPEPGEEGLPDWLVELEPPDEEEPIPELPTLEEAPPAPAIPEWLAALQAETVAGTTPTAQEMTPGPEPPDWLVPSAPRPEGEEGLALAEIPAWLLALKPAALRKEGEAEGPAPTYEEPVEETGLLAGIQGTLPVEMVIAQPRAVTSTVAVEPPAADTPQARLFAEIVSHPPEAIPREVAQARTRELGMVPRWILYLVLIVAVSLPLVLGKAIVPRTIEPAPSTADLYNEIESLSADAPVLVVFDYDPTSSGEMDVLSEAMVGHLMDKGARVVVVSLLPSGPATAQPTLQKLAAPRPAYANSYGQRYANLGYVSGQASAVRLLGLSLETALPRDFQGTPLSDLAVMEGLTSTQSFDMILELAATQDSVRWWVEQAATPYGIPLAAGVSASVDPLVRPYYESEARQLRGLVGGIPGAAMYEAQYRGQTGPTDATAVRLDALLAGHAVFILALLIGGLVYLMQRGGRREG